MPDPIVPRGPLQGLQDLSEQLLGQPKGMSTFLRGLVVGAFVGATIAGSALLRRRRDRDGKGIAPKRESPER
ncbi:MAG: hypothetical protein FJ038_03145 [Chloroflexi bacterium]|nr:hypothetical protein [Chloroflexota bacterium]